jgi:hypothetical protein
MEVGDRDSYVDMPAENGLVASLFSWDGMGYRIAALVKLLLLSLTFTTWPGFGVVVGFGFSVDGNEALRGGECACWRGAPHQ